LAALERGRRFVLSRRGADGLWRDFFTPAGVASEWTSGFIAATLLLAGTDAGELTPCADALVALQNDDGGWGYNEDVPTDADSTACVLLFLALIGGHETACGRGAACLAAHQRAENGGVATYREAGPIRKFMGVSRLMRFSGWCQPHTEVTATAGRALAVLEARAEAAAAWRYVRSRQRLDGAWNAYWWASPHYATLQAVELAALNGDQEAIARAADWALANSQSAGTAFATALSLSIHLHAGVGGDGADRFAARLCEFQDADGGWPSHPILRIPPPGDVDPNTHRRLRGIVVRDQHRTFTSAVCVAALAAVDSD
jgi:squalene cyclase